MDKLYLVEYKDIYNGDIWEVINLSYDTEEEAKASAIAISSSKNIGSVRVVEYSRGMILGYPISNITYKEQE